MEAIDSNEPLAIEITRAIREGDLPAVDSLLARNPTLAGLGIRSRCATSEGIRSLLHIATDWPGRFPRVSQTIRRLVDAGADVNCRFVGQHGETPLHWAASCDDVAAIDALLDAGADIDADGGVIADGTPLMDAAAFGQWRAAHRLLERGAKAGFWEAAALGLLEQIRSRCEQAEPPTGNELTSAFWGACHGNQQQTAEYLLQRGAELNWVGYDGLTPLDASVRSGASELAAWLVGLGALTRDAIQNPPAL